jgi:hypothetical protein
MPTPWFKKYNDWFLKTPGHNDAAPYGVGAEYRDGALFTLIGVHHLDQSENRGNHHVYVDVLDEHGQRLPNAVVAYTWQGRKEGALTVACDKPADEPAGNIPLQSNMTVDVWVWTLNEYGSDHATGIHTRHADEPSGNTWGHHSFYLVFQRNAPIPTVPPAPTPEPTPTPTPAPPTTPDQATYLDAIVFELTNAANAIGNAQSVLTQLQKGQAK